MVVITEFYGEKIRNSFTSHIKFVNRIWIKWQSVWQNCSGLLTKLVRRCKAVSPIEVNSYSFLRQSLCVNVLMDVYSKFYGLILYFALFINYPLKHMNKLINLLSYDTAIISSWDINKHLLHVNKFSPAKSVKYRCAVASIRPSVRTTRFHRFFIIWKDRD